MAKQALKANVSGFNPEQLETIKTIREAFESTRGYALNITDQSIVDIAAKVENFAEMDDAEEQLRFFDTAHELNKKIAIADPSISGLVAKMDAAFYAELDTNIEAFIKSKSSMLDEYGAFKRIWTKAQFDAIPYPGTDADDVKGTNYKPDIVEKKNTVGGGTIRTVFLDDLIAAMPRGKRCFADIKDTRDALKVSGSVKRFPVGEYGEQRLKDIQALAMLELNSIKRMFRGAIQLHHKLSAIEGMPKVKISWIVGEGDRCPVIPKVFGGSETIKITRSGRPLWIDPVGPDGAVLVGKGNSYSVAQVTAFDSDWALKQPDGGSVRDLIESGKPDAAGPEVKALSSENLDTSVVATHASLSSREAQAAFRLRALAKDNEELRESICFNYLAFRPIYEASKDWYDERLNGKTGNEKEEKAAKVA